MILLVVGWITLALGYLVLFLLVKHGRAQWRRKQTVPWRFRAMQSTRDVKVIGTRARDPAKKLVMIQELITHLCSAAADRILVEWMHQQTTSMVARIELCGTAVDVHVDCQYDIYATDAATQSNSAADLLGCRVMEMIQYWAHAYEVHAARNWEFGVHPKKWDGIRDPFTLERVDFLRDCIGLLNGGAERD